MAEMDYHSVPEGYNLSPWQVTKELNSSSKSGNVEFVKLLLENHREYIEILDFLNYLVSHVFIRTYEVNTSEGVEDELIYILKVVGNRLDSKKRIKLIRASYILFKLELLEFLLSECDPKLKINLKLENSGFDEMIGNYYETAIGIINNETIEGGMLLDKREEIINKYKHLLDENQR